MGPGIPGAAASDVACRAVTRSRTPACARLSRKGGHVSAHWRRWACLGEPICGSTATIRAPWPDWIEWKPQRIWCYDFTHFIRCRTVAIAVLDVVSRTGD